MTTPAVHLITCEIWLLFKVNAKSRHVRSLDNLWFS